MVSASTATGRSLDERPSYAADPAEVEVIHLSDDDVDTLVAEALGAAGCTREELETQAKAGQFTSEQARRMWFLVSSFDPAS